MYAYKITWLIQKQSQHHSFRGVDIQRSAYKCFRPLFFYVNYVYESIRGTFSTFLHLSSLFAPNPTEIR